VKKSKDEPEVEYQTNQPLDEEIKSTQKNIEDQEKKHGKWVVQETVQTAFDEPKRTFA
jgi:hypothetical protein